MVRPDDDGFHLAFFTCSSAWATTLSTVKPNFLLQILERSGRAVGAHPDAVTTQADISSQPNVDACSTETRGTIVEGMTDSRYAASCRSNNSHDGMLITRALMPFVFKTSCAPTQKADFAAGADEEHIRFSTGRFRKHISAARDS